MKNNTPTPKEQAKNKPARDTERPVDGRTELFVQIFLFSIGIIISSPILIAVLTSFKVPEDIINYPPTLLPYQQRMVEVEGYADPLPLFTVTFEDGTTQELVRIEQDGAVAVMIDPAMPEDSFRVARDQITRIEDIRFTFENYVTAWNSQPLGRYFLNSIVQTAVIVFFQVLFSILAAYAFGILEFPGRDIAFYLILGSLMVPFQLTFIPNFIFVSQLGLANTFVGLTVPFLASAFGVFLLRQFFKTLPKDLHDAARIDGASNWMYLWRIVVPLSRGSISAFAIFSFLGAWSQYLWPLVITNEQSMRTIQIGIRFFLFDQERGADWGGIMAAAVIALLPTLIVFLIAQRQLVRGIAMTGLKG